MRAKQVLVRVWITVMWTLFKGVNWLAIIALGIITYLLLANSEQDSYFGLTQTAWFSVCGSVFASFLFLLLQILTALFKDSTAKSFEAIYDDLVVTKGLCAVHFQRGSEELIKEYHENLQSASKRIYAIGITNRHFVNQHLSSLTETLSSRKIDVIVAFWDPDTEISIKRNGTAKSYKATDFHALMEHGTQSSYSDIVHKQQKVIIEKVNSLTTIKGRLRVLSLSSLTNFTCFIIDDDVYFFPFLARNVESTNDPTIHCSSKTGLGKIILEHFEQLFSRAEACATVFEKGPSS